MNKRFFFLLILFFAFPFFSLNGQSIVSDFDAIVIQIEDDSFVHGASTSALVDELHELSEKDPANIQKKIQWMYCKMILSYAQGINASDLMIDINACLDSLNAESYFFDYALLQYTLALGYVSKDDYGRAFTFALKALERFQQQNNRKFIIQALLLLESVCGFIENLSMSEDYYHQILKLVDSSQPQYYKAHLTFYNSLYSDKKFDEAIDSLTGFLPKLEHYGDTGLLAMAYANLSSFYVTKNDIEGSYPYLKKLQEIIKYIDNKQITSILCQNAGLYYLGIGQFEQAEAYFRKYKTIAIENNNAHYLFYANSVLYQMYQKQNIIDSAYFYLQQSFDLREQLINNSKIIEEYQAYVSILQESSKQELFIKEQQILLKNRRLTIVGVSAICIILLFVSSLIIVYQQKRNIRQQNLLKEAENKELEKKLQNDLQIQQFQKERIDAQIREITSISLLLSNKESVLKQIDAAAQQLPGNFSAVDDIRKIIKSNLNTSQAWNDFVLHFNKVHPSFFDKLKSFDVNLSETDFHLFAYFRIGMSTKQIAQILNITPEAVRMHRHRLKRKMGLSEQDDFNDFIRSI